MCLFLVFVGSSFLLLNMCVGGVRSSKLCCARVGIVVWLEAFVFYRKLSHKYLNDGGARNRAQLGS